MIKKIIFTALLISFISTQQAVGEINLRNTFSLKEAQLIANLIFRMVMELGTEVFEFEEESFFCRLPRKR